VCPSSTVKGLASVLKDPMSEENIIPVEVEAERESPTKSTIEVRDFELVIDEPEEMGGMDEGPNPLEYLLASQAGCLNVTATQVANDMGLTLEALAIEIEGDFDVAAFQTEQPDERTAVQNIEVTLAAETTADDETLDEWGERVEARCPVSDNIKNDTGVALSVERN
jgi:uncharacterized OsmC-like protein